MTHPKNALNAYCQKLGLKKPRYDTKGTGDEKEPLYISDVVIGDEVVATGQGSSRREAERVAAELALEALKGRFGEPEARAKKRTDGNRRARNGDADERAPLIPELLVESLRVAHERLPQGVKGTEAAEQVVRL
ncbi:MAG TPA: RNA-binding protein, partial [Oceanithermus sp.]|nr:RNA-binding protein [Oceanithermus sp.]